MFFAGNVWCHCLHGEFSKVTFSLGSIAEIHLHNCMHGPFGVSHVVLSSEKCFGLWVWGKAVWVEPSEGRTQHRTGS